MRLIPHRVGEPTTFTATCDNITATDSVGRNGASLGIRDRLDWCCAKGARSMPFRTRSGFFSVALLFALAAGASAQDGYHGQGHAENHDWYRDLKQPGTGYSCCNGTADGRFGDCRPTRAYLTEDGTWRATGTRDGVDIETIVTPDGEILSGFPTGGAGVHVNDAEGNPQPIEQGGG